MVRLGLSDSMRSTMSIEDTDPLHTAAHQPPRQPRAESPPPETDASNEQQTQAWTASVLLFNPLRVILGGLLAVVLLSTGAKVIGRSVCTWRSSNLHTGAQFERLERSIEVLGSDTARLQMTADRFLQSCQETQVVASTRTEMLQNVAKSEFDEKVRTQIQEHEEVVKEVMQYYAQQEQKVMETKERLMEMNITLPVQFAVRPVPKIWQQDEQTPLGGGEETREQGVGLAGAVVGLSLFAGTPQPNGDNDEHLSVGSFSSQINGQLESSNRAEQSTSSYGSFFFYTFVICASAVYLQNAISNTRKKELLDDKLLWSPVPKVLTKLKALLGSVMVVEDL